ncbi:MAG: tetratricopeptide repeat protein [Sphingomonas sp.]
MRISLVGTAAALTLVSISTSLHSQRPDNQIDAGSLQWLAKGKAANAAGKLDEATDDLETALAVDPRNREAFDLLGSVAHGRGLNGKAIRHYRDALLLDPNDRAAISGEGQALLAKGAVKQAKADLDKLQKLCKGPCPEAQQLAAAIAKGPPATALAAQVDTGAKPAAE